jgi:hypothetical protein
MDGGWMAYGIPDLLRDAGGLDGLSRLQAPAQRPT